MRHVRRSRSATAPTGSRSAARRSSDDGGYTVLEVLVSSTIFMTLAGATSLALLTSLRSAESNDSMVIATGLAAAQIEQARGVSAPATLVAGTTTIVRDGTTFTVRRTLLPASGCTATPATRTITISVSWTGNTVASDTVREC